MNLMAANTDWRNGTEVVPVPRIVGKLLEIVENPPSYQTEYSVDHDDIAKTPPQISSDRPQFHAPGGNLDSGDDFEVRILGKSSWNECEKRIVVVVLDDFCPRDGSSTSHAHRMCQWILRASGMPLSRLLALPVYAESDSEFDLAFVISQLSFLHREALAHPHTLFLVTIAWHVNMGEEYLSSVQHIDGLLSSLPNVAIYIPAVHPETLEIFPFVLSRALFIGAWNHSGTNPASVSPINSSDVPPKLFPGMEWQRTADTTHISEAIAHRVGLILAQERNQLRASSYRSETQSILRISHSEWNQTARTSDLTPEQFLRQNIPDGVVAVSHGPKQLFVSQSSVVAFDSATDRLEGETDRRMWSCVAQGPQSSFELRLVFSRFTPWKMDTVVFAICAVSLDGTEYRLLRITLRDWHHLSAQLGAANLVPLLAESFFEALPNGNTHWRMAESAEIDADRCTISFTIGQHRLWLDNENRLHETEVEFKTRNAAWSALALSPFSASVEPISRCFSHQLHFWALLEDPENMMDDIFETMGREMTFHAATDDQQLFEFIQILLLASLESPGDSFVVLVCTAIEIERLETAQRVAQLDRPGNILIVHMESDNPNQASWRFPLCVDTALVLSFDDHFLSIVETEIARRQYSSFLEVSLMFDNVFGPRLLLRRGSTNDRRHSR
eukprot:TRINITY_DN524_c0_g1_i13.p1 TRINITY_DN524_c0_g1~~TRINITY_DN524_c0_g1_i13.p1  ORF type:complete len:748 (+),score=135.91 TRINITY_DN524_c0_g1_i13:231-2246(+)